MVSLNRGEGRGALVRSCLAFGSFWLLVPLGWIGWRDFGDAALHCAADNCSRRTSPWWPPRSTASCASVSFEVVLVVLAAVAHDE